MQIAEPNRRMKRSRRSSFCSRMKTRDDQHDEGGLERCEHRFEDGPRDGQRRRRRRRELDHDRRRRGGRPGPPGRRRAGAAVATGACATREAARGATWVAKAWAPSIFCSMASA